jgi:hypothetical protein
MLCSLGSPAAISGFSGFRPLALRHALSGALPLSSYSFLKNIDNDQAQSVPISSNTTPLKWN